MPSFLYLVIKHIEFCHVLEVLKHKSKSVIGQIDDEFRSAT